MHTIEPFYRWRDYYIASEDKLSPFYERKYSEFEFAHAIYNYCIHPQWDDFGSPTLYLKILYVDYITGFAIIEMIGEWNDCINNDIMLMKREIIDCLIKEKINKFILIGENVLNFHASDDSYYEEWHQDIGDGWISLVNFREHVLAEMDTINLQQYLHMEEYFNNVNWRIFTPDNLFFSLSQKTRPCLPDRQVRKTLSVSTDPPTENSAGT